MKTNTNTPKQWLYSRKFVLVLGLIINLTTVLILKLITGSEYITALISITTAYLGAHAYTDVKLSGNNDTEAEKD